MLLRIALGAMVCLLGFGQDADLPSFMEGRIDKGAYLRARAAHLSLLRAGSADPRLREAAIRQLNQQRQQLRLNGPQQPGFVMPRWQPIGPAPIPNGQVAGGVAEMAVGGRVTAFEIHPTNPQILYLGTAQGGVYRSRDAGNSWTPIFDTFETSAIGALRLDPGQPSRLWIGTGEANLNTMSFAGAGLFRCDSCDTTPVISAKAINPLRTYTTPAGETRTAGVFNRLSISSIAVVPGNSNVLFVGTTMGVRGQEGEFIFPGPAENGIPGLVRLASATGPEASITAVKLPVNPTGCYDAPCTGSGQITGLALDPADASGNTLLAWEYGPAGGLFRSTDARAASVTFRKTGPNQNQVRGELVMYPRPGAPSVLYVASGEREGLTACSSGQGGSLRRSLDGGVTLPAPLPGGQGFCGEQCFFNMAVAIVPGPTPAADKILLGGQHNIGCSLINGVSTDGGNTFTRAEHGLHVDVHFLRVTNGGRTVYHGSDGGLFRSLDGGLTWSSMNTADLNTVQFTSVAVHPASPTFTMGGTQDNGTNLRDANGVWRRVDWGDGGFAVIDRNGADPANTPLYHTYFNASNFLLGYARVNSLSQARDGWPFYGCFLPSQTSNNGITCSDSVLFYAPLEQGPGNPNTIYYGTNRLYRSADRGVSHTVVSPAPLSSPISAIGISPQDDLYRVIGLSNGELHYTTTGSAALRRLGAGVIPAEFVGRIRFDPSDKNTVYIALGGYLAGAAHVWKVTGLSGTPVIRAAATGLPDVPVNALAVDPANPANVFAGTDIGVYYSSDAGASWQPYGEGLPVVAIFGMEIQASGRLLRIATHGRGMWDAPLPPLTPADAALTKSHTGSFIPGQTGATYTLTVTNQGGRATASPVTVTETLPAGLTATSIGGAGWTCTQPAGPCTRADALAPGAGYPALQLTVNIAATASGTVTNCARVSLAGDENPENDQACDPAVLPTLADFTLTKSHVGDFRRGQKGGVYSLAVRNAAASATSGGLVTVRETAPAGLTITAISGTGWTCPQPAGPCTRSDALAAGAAYPALQVTVDVAANAPANVTNCATVTLAGDSNAANDTGCDPTRVLAADLAIAKTHAGSFNRGQTGAVYTLTVRNNGPDAHAGLVTVTDSLPGGLSASSIGGAGWTCTQPAGPCTRADALASGAAYPPLLLTANVEANAPASVTNCATVTHPAGTHTACDPTAIADAGMPDVTLEVTRGGDFVRGQTGATLFFTIRNVGAGVSRGTVGVSTMLPASLPATAINGPGWTCAQPTGPCSRTGTLAAGDAFPPLTVTVNVSDTAPATLLPCGIVTAEGDPNDTNDTGCDPTPIGTGGGSATLALTKSHVGDFVRGQSGAVYTLVVRNTGTGEQRGTVTVTDQLPAGLTGVSIAGAGWSCVQPVGPCTRTDALAAGANYPALTVTVNVATTASGTVTNCATANGATACDATRVLAPELAISKSHVGDFVRGQNGAVYTLVVRNNGADPHAGSVTVSDQLPAGLTGVSIGGAGWSCVQPVGPCTRTDALAAGASYPALTVTVNVATTASGTVTNCATANGAAACDATRVTDPALPSIQLPAQLVLEPGLSQNVTLRLSQPAPSEGLFIRLTSSDVSVAGAVPFVILPPGARERSIRVSAGSANGIATLTASTAAGYLSATMEIRVQAATSVLAVETAGLAAGRVGVAYSQALAAVGGRAPYTWSLVGGALPAGLMLQPTTGVVSGVPSVAGSAVLTLRVTDASDPAQAAQATLTLTIAPAEGPGVTAVGGSPQAAPVNMAFGRRLAALVRDGNGNPAPGVMVTFTVGSGANGASAAFSGVFSGAIAATGTDGIATAPVLVANGLMGTYTVTAAASGSASQAVFSLTNESAVATPLSFVVPPSVTLTKGVPAAFEIRLSGPAPVGGVFVTLASTDPTVASPTTTTVLIEAGQTSTSRVQLLSYQSGTVTLSLRAPLVAPTALTIYVP